MPTGTEVAILSLIAAITIPALAAYGNLRDRMATMQAQLKTLESVDNRQQQDLMHESRRNDSQDEKINALTATLSRIDSNVQRLVDIDNNARRTSSYKI